MTGQNAIFNLLAINSLSIAESWYDEVMQEAISYAIKAIAEKDNIDLQELREGVLRNENR